MALEDAGANARLRLSASEVGVATLLSPLEAWLAARTCVKQIPRPWVLWEQRLGEFDLDAYRGWAVAERARTASARNHRPWGRQRRLDKSCAQGR